MQNRRIVIALIVCLGLSCFTILKLEEMTEIKGSVAVRERVVRKTAEHGKRADYCYFWTPQKVQSDCGYWSGVQVGDMIEVITVEGDRHVKGGEIYASDGNFAFDKALLVVEIGGALVCVVLLILRRRR
jgi:hypothetical protein